MAPRKHKVKDKPVPILIVDDVGMVRQTLMRMLRVGKFDVLEAANAEEAVRILDENEPSLIILDVKMPGVDGIKFCGELKQAERTKNIPILMCTAMTERSFVVRALQAGASDYIVKPFEASTVLQKVRKALGIPDATPAPAKIAAETNDEEE